MKAKGKVDRMGMKANKPDFTGINQMIGMLRELDGSFLEMTEGVLRLKEDAEAACREKLLSQAVCALADIPVEELENSSTPVRTSLLLDAGYRNLKDLYSASDEEILAVSGIGAKQLAAIRFFVEEFRQTIAGREGIRLRPDEPDAPDRDLVTKTARFLNAEPAVREALEVSGDLHARILQLTDSVTIRGGLRWFFSSRKKKEESIRAVGEMIAFCDSPQYHRTRRFIAIYQQAAGMSEEQALADFRRNSASYYAWFEKAAGPEKTAANVYESIPLQLASEINGEELDLSGFKGNLRSYQEFGARYVLHQKRVLLGDEMGLGKTIQAIAAMTHLCRKEPDSHFLVVCPTSVLINWIREIHRFSSMEAFLLHGPSTDTALAAWKDRGGAAVTNFESMEKVAGFADNSIKLALLVVDEAHYIKNPQAKRTQRVRSLEDEAERILLMTGTPLENHVEEMCELIRFVRPDLEEGIRQKAQLRHLPEFREMLAPVYLRRRRDQVLLELPPITEEQEWCVMTPEDQAAYQSQLQCRNFMGMRRVSFLQDDLFSSAKASRLLELYGDVQREGRKAILFSYFRETVKKVQDLLQGACVGTLTGSDTVAERQRIIDGFAAAPAGSVLVCQIQAGGTGLNLQAASVVIFCEPQIKPSLTAQAIARVHRMGQTENTLVFHLLCEGTVDEAVNTLMEEKQEEFDLYADESVMADAAESLPDPEWIRQVIDEQRRKYLPAVYVDPTP